MRLLKQVLPPDREENLHFLQGLIQGHTELGPETRIPASKFNSFYYIIPPLLDKSRKKGSLKTELIKKGLYGCGIVGNEPRMLVSEDIPGPTQEMRENKAEGCRSIRK